MANPYEDSEIKDKVYEKWKYTLSVRAKNCLVRMEITNDEDLRRAILSGELDPKLNPKNFYNRDYGLTTHREICKYLKLPTPGKIVTYVICSNCGKEHQFDYSEVKRKRIIEQ